MWRDAVHAAEPVGDERDRGPVAVGAGQLELLAAEERGRRGVRDRREACVEQLERSACGSSACPASSPTRDRCSPTAVGELALVDPAGAPVEVRVAQLALLEQLEQLALVDTEVHRDQPGAQQRARILGPEIAPSRALPDVALAHHSLDDLEHRRRVGAGLLVAGRAHRIASAIAAWVHFAALPWSPWAATRPARMCERNSAGVAAHGVSVNVRPISTPA